MADTSHHAQAPPAARGGGIVQRLLAWVPEFTQFGVVGALAFVIDMGLFNAFQHGPIGFLAGHPNTSHVLSATIATIFSWVANRTWTYRGRTRDNVAREALLFAFANIGGILITQFCLVFAHHALGLTGPLADNIAAYVVGFGLGTAFRFIFYHYIVFTGGEGAAGHPPAAHAGSESVLAPAGARSAAAGRPEQPLPGQRR